MKILITLLCLILIACSGGSGGGGVIDTDPPVTNMPTPNPIDNSLKIKSLSLSNLAAVYQNSQNNLIIEVSNTSQVSEVFVFNVLTQIFFKPTCEVTSSTILTCKDIHFYAINFGSISDNAYRVRIISTDNKDVFSVGAIEISSLFADESPTGLVIFPAAQCGSVSGVAGQADFSCTLNYALAPTDMITVSWKPLAVPSTYSVFSSISFDSCQTKNSQSQSFNPSGEVIYNYSFYKEDISSNSGSKTLSLMLYESTDNGNTIHSLLACQDVGVMKVVEDSYINTSEFDSIIAESNDSFIVNMSGEVTLTDPTNLFKFYQIYIRNASTNETLYYDSNHSFNESIFRDFSFTVNSDIVSEDTDVILEINLTTESGNYIIIQNPIELVFTPNF